MRIFALYEFCNNAKRLKYSSFRNRILESTSRQKNEKIYLKVDDVFPTFSYIIHNSFGDVHFILDFFQFSLDSRIVFLNE